MGVRRPAADQNDDGKSCYRIRMPNLPKRAGDIYEQFYEMTKREIYTNVHFYVRDEHNSVPRIKVSAHQCILELYSAYMNKLFYLYEPAENGHFHIILSDVRAKTMKKLIETLYLGSSSFSSRLEYNETRSLIKNLGMEKILEEENASVMEPSIPIKNNNIKSNFKAPSLPVNNNNTKSALAAPAKPRRLPPMVTQPPPRPTSMAPPAPQPQDNKFQRPVVQNQPVQSQPVPRPVVQNQAKNAGSFPSNAPSMSTSAPLKVPTNKAISVKTEVHSDDENEEQPQKMNIVPPQQVKFNPPPQQNKIAPPSAKKQKVSGGKSWNCPKCPTVFNEVEILHSHLALHFKEEILLSLTEEEKRKAECPKCGDSYGNEVGLIGHLGLKHKIFEVFLEPEEMQSIAHNGDQQVQPPQPPMMPPPPMQAMYPQTQPPATFNPPQIQLPMHPPNYNWEGNSTQNQNDSNLLNNSRVSNPGFNETTNLQIDTTITAKNGLLKCYACPFSTNNKENLKQHIPVHLTAAICQEAGIDRKSRRCPKCQQDVGNNAKLIRHLAYIHKMIYKVVSEQILENTVLKVVLAAEKEDEVADELDLNHIYKKNDTLIKANHRKVVKDGTAGMNTYECPICDTKLYAKNCSPLKIHILKHIEDDIVDKQSKENMLGQNSQCSECQKEFKQKKNLAFHTGIEHDLLSKYMDPSLMDKLDPVTWLPKDPGQMQTANPPPVKIQTNGGEFTCPIRECRDENLTKAQIFSHIVKHLKSQVARKFRLTNDSMKCDKCGKYLVNNEALIHHILFQHRGLNLVAGASVLLEHPALSQFRGNCEYLPKVKQNANDTTMFG